MPDISVATLFQWAVLWPATGVYSASGQMGIGPPKDIRCRWTLGKSEAMDKDGNTVSLDGKLFVAIRIDDGSQVWVGGRLKDWYGVGSAGGLLGDTQLMETKNFDFTPDTKGRFATRTIGLMRLRNKN